MQERVAGKRALSGAPCPVLRCRLPCGEWAQALVLQVAVSLGSVSISQEWGVRPKMVLELWCRGWPSTVPWRETVQCAWEGRESGGLERHRQAGAPGGTGSSQSSWLPAGSRPAGTPGGRVCRFSPCPQFWVGWTELVSLAQTPLPHGTEAEVGLLGRAPPHPRQGSPMTGEQAPGPSNLYYKSPGVLALSSAGTPGHGSAHRP